MRCKNPVMNQILDAYKPMWSLKHAISLMGWDFETYMPREGTEERGVADSQLHMLHKDLLLNKDFIGLVESAKKLGSSLALHESQSRFWENIVGIDSDYFVTYIETKYFGF
jgi:Zn-dependent M32 family carboxypeptidase